MAIIYNISEAIKSSAFNVLGLSIPMLLDNQVEEFEKGSKIGEIFVKQSLSGYSQSYHTAVSHGGFRPSEDMEIAKLHDWEDSYGKTFTAQTWKDSFAISQEALEDNKDLEIRQKVAEFGTNYARTREQYCAATVAGALKSNYSYGGKTFKVNSIDSVDATVDGAKEKYFNKYHRTSVKVADADDFVEMNGQEAWEVGKEYTDHWIGTSTAGLTTGDKYATPPQANKFLVYGGKSDATSGKPTTDGLNLMKINPVSGDTAENVSVYEQVRFILDKIREIGKNHRDYDGRLVPLNYSKIVMPSNSKLKKTLKAALGATRTSEDFDGPLKGDDFSIVEWPYLNGLDGFKEKEMGFIVLDPQRNSSALGFTLWDRIPLTVKSYLTDGNDTMVWYGRARFKADTCDPYSACYVALGNLQDLSAAAYSGASDKFSNETVSTNSATLSKSNAVFISLQDFTLTEKPAVYVK